MKCIFKNNEEYCTGKLTEMKYEVPCNYWNFPKVYKCYYHRDKNADWKDALNSQSNVLTMNRRMIHTKEFEGYQGFEFWIGNCEEIVFCVKCNGTGEDGNCIESPIVCKECNGTGRKS